MQPGNPPNPPPMPTLKTFSDVTGAVKKLFEYVRVHASSDQDFESAVSREVTYLYGEYDLAAPLGIGNLTQSLITITVDSAIPGYCVDVAYDNDLQGVSMTAYVSAANTVKVLLMNTGGADPITLAAGKFRVFVWPRRFAS